ncbi:hypothetical protein ACC685_37845, partial [Rhizobium ruizarguesonis]
AFPQSREQIDISGKDFVLKPDSVQNLGLALHELATNSVKYGALSVPQGEAEILHGIRLQHEVFAADVDLLARLREGLQMDVDD